MPMSESNSGTFLLAFSVHTLTTKTRKCACVCYHLISDSLIQAAFLSNLLSSLSHLSHWTPTDSFLSVESLSGSIPPCLSARAQILPSPICPPHPLRCSSSSSPYTMSSSGLTFKIPTVSGTVPLFLVSNAESKSRSWYAWCWW